MKMPQEKLVPFQGSGVRRALASPAAKSSECWPRPLRIVNRRKLKTLMTTRGETWNRSLPKGDEFAPNVKRFLQVFL